MDTPVKEKVNLTSNIIDLIHHYSDKKCHVCLRKLNQYNQNTFFEFPLNNKHSKFYCSQLCYQHY